MRVEWQRVQQLPPLAAGELQLWRVNLLDFADDPESYMKNLSPFEVERAGRLREGQVRLQFVIARSCLRLLLGNLLNSAPERVPINLGVYGKPETPSTGQPLFFNVAHARETILIALSRAGSVGVDVEYLDRETEALAIAKDSFTRNEFHQIEQTLDPAERQRAFFRCWTRKEAVVKADGRGLSIALDSVEVPVNESAISTAVSILEKAGGEDADGQWFVSDIQLGEGIAAAFAVDVRGLHPSTFSFPLTLLRQR